MVTTSIIVIICCVASIILLSGIDTVVRSTSKFSWELNKKNQKYYAKVWTELLSNPSNYLTTLLVAFVFFLTIYGLTIGTALTPVWNWIAGYLGEVSDSFLNFIRLLFETTLAVLILVFALYLTRPHFKNNAYDLLANNIFAWVGKAVYTLFGWLTKILISISDWILQYIFDVPVKKSTPIFIIKDIETISQQYKYGFQDGTSEVNLEMFENALNVGDKKIRECLVPRKEVVSIDEDKTVQEATDLFSTSKLSRIITTKNDSIDNITGYIHQLDMFKNPTTIKQIVKSIITVPDTMYVMDLMKKFSKEHRSIAWVVDEYGGTAGIVTMEDLLEEIFGEIKDEHDTEDDNYIEKQISPTEYIFSGRAELDHLEEKYHLHFVDRGDAETLNGYILQDTQNIPKVNERIIIGNYEYTILTATNTQIETVKLKTLS